MGRSLQYFPRTWLVTDTLQDGRGVKVSVKVNLGVSLKFFVCANLELVGCEVYFPKKTSEKLISKPLKFAFLCFPP